MKKEDIQVLGHLSKIELSDDEQIQLLANLQKVLNYIEDLKSIDTEGVPPCDFVLENAKNCMAEDAVSETLNIKEFLDNAPSSTGGMIRVPPVIQF
ncbi:MAG TPA: Asp-tRNA(Asn)/Glu-tRNA(Gln) amidotransferase subunit GatC [Chlamydiales bacterium]|nr:Asp-tRNA(Asn)/Glu-tRNA(Gln) amidotransferase subunit GatC [Chlamydiales bacterium]HPE85641.1 Asp-tRNA(Asn)/Glu-tRNA(Gln) amidotransferase subunit GatC [Chlamydiales bacterium]